MSSQDYWIINESTNICENIVVWDGNTETWSPPPGHIALPRDSVLAKNWFYDADLKDYVLTVSGGGGISFIWDGTYLINPLEKPTMPPPYPSSGA